MTQRSFEDELQALANPKSLDDFALAMKNINTPLFKMMMAAETMEIDKLDWQDKKYFQAGVEFASKTQAEKEEILQQALKADKERELMNQQAAIQQAAEMEKSIKNIVEQSSSEQLKEMKDKLNAENIILQQEIDDLLSMDVGKENENINKDWSAFQTKSIDSMIDDIKKENPGLLDEKKEEGVREYLKEPSPKRMKDIVSESVPKVNSVAEAELVAEAKVYKKDFLREMKRRVVTQKKGDMTADTPFDPFAVLAERRKEMAIAKKRMNSPTLSQLDQEAKDLRKELHKMEVSVEKRLIIVESKDLIIKNDQDKLKDNNKIIEHIDDKSNEMTTSIRPRGPGGIR